MNYRVLVKRLIDGQYHARCNAAPLGLAETFADTREDLLSKLRKKIRYRLEWCPCSGISDDAVQLDIEEISNGHANRLAR